MQNSMWVLYSASDTSHHQPSWPFCPSLFTPALLRIYSFCEKIWGMGENGTVGWWLNTVTRAKGFAGGKQSRATQPAPTLPRWGGSAEAVPTCCAPLQWAEHREGWCCQKCENSSPISPPVNLFSFFFFLIHVQLLSLVSLSFTSFMSAPLVLVEEKVK